LLSVPKPRAGLAGAGLGVLLRILLPCLDQVDAVQQRRVHRIRRSVREIGEAIETAQPVAFLSQAAVVAAIAGRIKKALVWTVLKIDAVQYK
jgi:hypothetical protein